MKKILLLNPPSDRLYIRDYYCSFSSKANYYWPPQDLIVLSGILKNKFNVDYLDLCISNFGFQKNIKLILDKEYDAIVFTSGSVSLRSDFLFLKMLKEQQPKIKIIASGSIFLFIGKEIMEQFEFLDGILLDFSNLDIIDFLFDNYAKIENMLYRDKGGGIVFKKTPLRNNFSIPLPFHKLFINESYKMLFLIFKNKLFLTTIASMGCPFKCNFCTAGSIAYRYRDTENLLNEINYIYEKLNIKNIFFADPHFIVDSCRIKDVCEEIIKNRFDKLSWICNSRIEPLLGENLVKLLKKQDAKWL